MFFSLVGVILDRVEDMVCANVALYFSPSIVGRFGARPLPY